MNFESIHSNVRSVIDASLDESNIRPEALFNVSLGIDDDAKQFAEGLLSQLQDNLSQGVNINHGVSEETESAFKGALSLVEILLDVGVICFAVWSTTCGRVSYMAVAAALVTLRFGHISQKLCGIFKNQVQAESYSSITAALLGGGVLFKLLECMLHAATFAECYDYCLSTIRSYCNDTTASSLDTFLAFVQRILDAVCRKFTGKDCPFSVTGKSSQRTRECLKNIEALMVAKQANQIALDELVVQLEVESKALQKAISELPKGSALSSVASHALSTVSRMIVEINTIRVSSSGSRVEPVCYIFVGPPGIGKTMFNNVVCDYFVYELASDYMREYFSRDPKAVHRQVYALNQTDQYSSGYRNQPVVLIDEIDPDPPTTGLVSTPCSLIRMINSVSCPLNMPDLGSKGVTFFDSKVIVGTTNVYNWGRLPGVSNADAFYRRVNFVTCTPNVVALQADFFAGSGIKTFEQMRPRMQQYMMEQYELYRKGDYTLEEYLDNAYKYVCFAVSVPNKVGTVSNLNGIAISPSALIRRVVKEAKAKEAFAGNRNDLTERIINERATYHASPIRAESGFVSSLRNMISTRYNFDTPVYNTAFRSHFDTIAHDNYELYVVMTGMKKCECPKCECVKTRLGNTDVTGIAVRLARLAKVKGSTQPEIEDFVSSMIKEPKILEEFTVDFVGVNSFCKLETKNDGRDTLRYIALFAHLQEAFVNTMMEKTKPIFKVFSAGRVIADIATVLIIVKFAHMAYTTLTSQRETEPEGVYPLRPKEKAKKTAIKMRVHDVTPQGGPEDLMYAIARTNVYKFDIVGKKPGGKFSSHFTMVQNQVALTPIHTVRGIIDAYEFDPEAIMIIKGCIHEDKTGYTMKKQEIPLCNLVIREDDCYTIRGGITEVCQRFANPDGEIVPTDVCMITIPVSARKRTAAFHDATFFDRTIDHIERQGCLMTIADKGSVQIDNTSMYFERDWQMVKCTNDSFVNPNGFENEEGTHWFGTRILKYIAETKVGYCGAPVFMRVGGTYKIVGIHVAGATRGAWGYAVGVTMEDIERSLVLHATDKENSAIIESTEEEIVAESSFAVAVGRGTSFGHQETLRVRAPSSPTKSSLVYSPLYNRIKGPNRAPALLKPKMIGGELVDPVAVAQSEYGHVEKAPKLWLAKQCMRSVFGRAMQAVPLVGETTIPSYEEVVNPGVLFSFVRSIPRGTSAGYPYCLTTKKKGKLDFFGDGQDYDFSSPKWRDLIIEAESVKAQILGNKRPLFINFSFPKDERRSIEKVETGKTRLISGGSLLFTLLLRQYTMGFFNFVVRTRGVNGIAIGTNPYSEDWDSIARRMGARPNKPQEHNCIAGDFSGFDKKLHYVWIMEFCDIITEFYGDKGSDSAKIRKALFFEIAFSRHVVGDVVVDWVGSNPSGQSMTTPTNSASNAAMLRYVIVSEILIREGKEVNEFNAAQALDDLFKPGQQAIQEETFGDDSLIAILDTLGGRLDWLDGQTLSDAFMSHLEIKYTDESKSDEQQKLRRLSDCSFLKRGFKSTGLSPTLRGRFMAPLELDSILDSIRWYKPSNDGKGLGEWAENVTHMLEELSLHEPEVYQRVGNEIVTACRQLERRPANLPVVLEDQALAQIKCCARELEY